MKRIKRVRDNAAGRAFTSAAIAVASLVAVWLAVGAPFDIGW